MSKSDETSTMDKHKMYFIYLLYGSAFFIMFLGLYFSFFSMLNHINIKVLNSSIHGVLFGFLVFYLGIRYFLSVNKLQMEVLQSTSRFSWHNFKKSKSNKKSS